MAQGVTLAKNLVVERAPTMIIPNGTQIEVDMHGQLSVRTPGNLVLQNSGNYGTIESIQGSIRIEPNVQVEAVQVKCADVCYVQGSLTAWKVQARALELEESARAHIILQETESLQIGREARLVGNFSSENELFLLFSRFAREMRSLPFGDRRDATETETSRLSPEQETKVLAAGDTSNGEASLTEAEAADAPAVEPADSELPDSLFFALVLLERESEKPGGGPSHKRIVGELVRLLRQRDIETLRRTYESFWSQIPHASDDLRRVRELIADHFG